MGRGSYRGLGAAAAVGLAAGLLASSLPAQTPGLSVPAALDRMLQQEHAFNQQMRGYHPRVETYIQQLGPDRDRGTVPIADAYYLGILDLTRGFQEPLFASSNQGRLAKEFFPVGFSGMLSPDWRHFDQQHYRFRYQGEQFLGSVRCLVFNLTPRPGTAHGSFMGRLWAEDQGFHIVRFDGTYVPNPKHKYVHFDSWRANVGPDLWLPVAIYSQEEDQRTGWFSHIAFKAQVRFWGYALSLARPQTRYADLSVDPASAVTGAARPQQLRPPLAQQRAWEQKAAQDVLTRLQQAGLLAPPGPVDQVLDTVARNLEITNKLNFTPPVTCRVLLITPLESFTVGHTIVLSRGLIDVLPDEASLAMMLAHELGHIDLGQGINTEYAFDDVMMFPDIDSFLKLRLTNSPSQEAAADRRGLQLLDNSPYRNDLAQPGLFLEALDRAARGVPNLLSPHLGNPMVLQGRVARMHALLTAAPLLQTRDLHQLPALPLGARIHLDPWSDQLSLLDAASPALLSPADKLSFEITPFMPFLEREAARELALRKDGVRY